MMGRLQAGVWGLLILLTGCSAAGAGPEDTPGPNASPTATSNGASTGSVLATGSLIDSHGGAVGNIEVRVAEGGASEVVLSNYVPVEGSVSLQLSPETLTFEGCHDTGPVLEVGEIDTDPDQVFYAGRFDDLPFNSKFVMAGLMADTAPSEDRNCLLRVVAVAELTWADD